MLCGNTSPGNAKQVKCTRESVIKSMTDMVGGRHSIYAADTHTAKRRKVTIHLHTALSRAAFLERMALLACI